MKRLVSIAWLAACGGGGGSTDIDATLVFADRSDVEISRLISAAGGTDMFSAEAQLESYSDPFMPDPCPAIAISGNTVTITGGCTTAEGETIAGDAVITNPTSWDEIEYQFGDPTVYELHGFSTTRDTFTQRYDGIVTIDDSFTTWDCDVTNESFGLIIRSDLHYHCSNQTSCSLSGSGLELVGVGGAKVSGDVHVDGQSSTADYTLRGVDTLTAHITSGCVEWHISGTERGMDCP
jgi:hypothetical protein